MQKYSYAALAAPGVDLGFVRLSGPGLANCLFMACRAYLDAKDLGLEFVDPTWRKISIGPYLRGERDKRAYSDLFTHRGVSGLKKMWLLARMKVGMAKDVHVVPDISGYFIPLYGRHKEVKEYIDSITIPETISLLQGVDLSHHIAVHVRLGDYNQSLRIPLEWYDGIINKLLELDPTLKFALFSDGTDEELALLLRHPEVARHFYGNAFADMTAISKCRMLIASDSTFSAWGAYLGQIPIIFNRRHFPPVYPENSITEVIVPNEIDAYSFTIAKLVD
ncbi:alpha-1,2-fucosyltransferase [Muribaculum intestinale]|uniref:alpha-1,2-fucosyltransferase n=1 Tax=Muribaculum intestinale TaxID=1796646 RepID=UPI002613DB6A|nr:alpha-1,2-fucosyltransferase [Muribaculum intestinale]